MISYGKRLSRDFYQRDTVTVANDLLGKLLVRVQEGVPLVAEITETEAYTGIADKACHSYNGRKTERTRIMYGPGGFAYVYLIYGMHCLFNVVTEGEGNPCAVLIRKCEPVDGLNQISQNRYKVKYSALGNRRVRGLLDGPGKICKGLGITRKDNGECLYGSRIFIAEPLIAKTFDIGSGKRINIDYAEEAADWPYRFFIPKDGEEKQEEQAQNDISDA